MKRMQFSKWHVLFANFLVSFVWVSTVLLSFFDKQPVDTVAVAIITAYGGFATGGYFVQNMVRDTSLNKLEQARIEHGVDGVG